MLSPKFYIIQLLGVLLLLCGYFLSDPADGLAAMHFNPNPSRPSVISKASKAPRVPVVHKIGSTQNHHSGKSSTAKYISFAFIVPTQSGYHFRPLARIVYSCPLPETYSFLFYKEINPPPPKMC